MTVYSKRTFRTLFALSVAVLCSGCAAGQLYLKVDPDRRAIVIGRLAGHVLKQRGELYAGNGYESETMIIDGWELRNEENGDITKVYMNAKGFFAVAVTPGPYTLYRSHEGEEDYKVKKESPLAQFAAGRGDLVNLGTYQVLQGKTLGGLFTGFVVLYRIERMDKPDYALDVLNWFRKSNRRQYEAFKDREVRPFEPAFRRDEKSRQSET